MYMDDESFECLFTSELMINIVGYFFKSIWEITLSDCLTT